MDLCLTLVNFWLQMGFIIFNSYLKSLNSYHVKLAIITLCTLSSTTFHHSLYYWHTILNGGFMNMSLLVTMVTYWWIVQSLCSSGSNSLNFYIFFFISYFILRKKNWFLGPFIDNSWKVMIGFTHLSHNRRWRRELDAVARSHTN